MLFETFGEFDSSEELNRAARAQLEQGDDEALMALARENGIDTEDARDYIGGETDKLTTPLLAAYGKLAVEEEELCPYGILVDWIRYIKICCAEDDGMAAAVRRKGKSLKGCISALVGWSLKNAKPVDREILKKAGIAYQVTLGIPDMGQARKMITEYYMGGK